MTTRVLVARRRGIQPHGPFGNGSTRFLSVSDDAEDEDYFSGTVFTIYH